MQPNDAGPTVSGDPPYQVLPAAPRAREPQLNSGVWLALVYAVWSVPDLAARAVAEAVARRFAGRVRVGVRPFDDHAELKAWCPDAKEQWGSPLWLILRDGALVEELVGLQSEEALTDALRRATPTSRTA